MKRRMLFMMVLAGLFVLLFNISVLAEEAVFQNEAELYAAVIKANLGFQLGVLHLNLDELNNILDSGNFAPLSENMFVIGGRGLVGAKEDNRIGGYGFNGRVYSSKGAKKACLDIGYGGLLYEKALYFDQKTDIALGALIGGGGANLQLVHYSHDSVGDAATGDGSTDYFSKGFFVFAPGLSIHRQLSTFVGLDIAVNYILTYDFSTPWKVFDKTVDGPLKNFGAPSISVGLAIGF